MSTSTLFLPTLGKEIPRPWFLPSAETIREQERILSGRFFLVRIAGNAGIGDALICRACGGKHQYITLRCVEQPFSALTGGLYAYFRAVGDNGLESLLSPSEQARYEAIKSTVMGGLPDVSSSHPMLARRMTATIAPTDAQLSALGLGVVEPIPPSLARKYADRINSRGIRPRFTLPGLEAA